MNEGYLVMRNRARTLRRTMTDAEKRVWEALRRDQCDGLRFWRQEVLDQYIADFYCPALKLVVEIDGTSHDSAEAQRYDADRTQSLFEARGLRVIRLRNEAVLKATPHQIRQAVLRKIASLPPPINLPPPLRRRPPPASRRGCKSCAHLSPQNPLRKEERLRAGGGRT